MPTEMSLDTACLMLRIEASHPGDVQINDLEQAIAVAAPKNKNLIEYAAKRRAQYDALRNEVLEW